MRDFTLDSLKGWLSWVTPCDERRGDKNRGNPHHNEDLEKYGWCPGCGQSNFIIFHKGDHGVILTDQGEVIAGIVNEKLYILDYEKAKRLAAKEGEIGT